MKAHNARVRWMDTRKRGRKQLPPTLRYLALSRFPEEGPTWPDGAWTIEVIFAEPPPEQSVMGDESVGMVRFLFPGAPHERLRSGACFSLYEGPTKVAEVDVLD